MLRPLSLDCGLAVATARAAYRRAWLAPLTTVLLDSQAPRQTTYSTPHLGAGKIARRPDDTDLCLGRLARHARIGASLSRLAKAHAICVSKGRMVYTVSLARTAAGWFLASVQVSQ